MNQIRHLMTPSFPPQVGLVALDNPSRVPSVITRNRGVGETNRVVPVCTDTIFELDSFVSSFTPQGDTSGFNIEYTDAFQMALSLFSTTTDAGELAMLLWFKLALQGFIQDF